MNGSNDLIINSLEYYDKNRDKYAKFFAKIKHYSMIQDDKDTGHNTIIFYDKYNNELLRSTYEIMGIYTNFSNTWAWAWADPLLQKNKTYISKKILNYGLNIESPNEIFLKTELITSRFRIVIDVQLEVHIAIASYISKTPLIFNMYRKLKDIEYGSDGYFKIEDINKDELYTLAPLFILEPEKINFDKL